MTAISPNAVSGLIETLFALRQPVPNEARNLPTCYSNFFSTDSFSASYIRMTIGSASRPLNKLFAFLFFSAAIVAFPTRSVGQVAPRWEVFGGYSYRRMDSTSLGFSDYSNLNGWNAEGMFNLSPRWSIVADLSGHYGSHLSIFDYMAGPQFNWRRDRSKIFVHALFGKAQNTINIANGTQTYFKGVGHAVGVGVGYDWDFSPRFTIRVGQADFISSHTFDANQNDIRVSTGLVFHFGQIGHRPKL